MVWADDVNWDWCALFSIIGPDRVREQNFIILDQRNLMTDLLALAHVPVHSWYLKGKNLVERVGSVSQEWGKW